MSRFEALAVVALAVAVALPAQAADTQLKAAVAGAQRSAVNKARDGARHPVESLTFWGLKPRQTVIEISPGGQLVRIDTGISSYYRGKCSYLEIRGDQVMPYNFDRSLPATKAH